jgi:hypothetical protein
MAVEETQTRRNGEAPRQPWREFVRHASHERTNAMPLSTQFHIR